MSKVVLHQYKDPFTHVQVEGFARAGNNRVKVFGSGFAKRNLSDTPNKQIGFEIALSRAKKDLYEKRAKLKQHS